MAKFVNIVGRNKYCYKKLTIAELTLILYGEFFKYLNKIEW